MGRSVVGRVVTPSTGCPPTQNELAKARTHKGDQELLIDLLADTEFIEMAGSADPGFVHTTGQRLLQRDLSTTEALHLHRRAR
mgnify:CR=1 FL=1